MNENKNQTQQVPEYVVDANLADGLRQKVFALLNRGDSVPNCVVETINYLLSDRNTKNFYVDQTNKMINEFDNQMKILQEASKKEN